MIPHTKIGGALVADGLAAACAGTPSKPQHITYTDLALACALGDVPDLHGRGAEDGSVNPDSTININLAISTPAGVAAPARGDGVESRELAPGCRTLSHLGAYPVDFFRPVLSGPQVSLVALGGMAERRIAELPVPI